MYPPPPTKKLGGAGNLPTDANGIVLLPSVRRGTDQSSAGVDADFSNFESPGVQDLGVEDRSMGSMEGQRFVAGEQFYNYEMYGSLRKGGTTKFFSYECIGLVAATFSSVISYQCLQSVTRPVMGTQLKLTPQENNAVLRLVEIPMAMSFFVGLLSDGYPILGLRRKGYMVLGLVLNAVSVVVLALLSMYFESLKSTDHRNGVLVVLAIIMISLASLGCIITYLSVQTRVIELSQQEPLRIRGAIVAEYLIFRRLASIVGSLYTFLTIGTGTTPTVAFSTAMLILAALCAAPLPIILKFWQEEHYNLPTSMKIRAQIFWKIMQQKAVWRTLMFIVMFVCFLGIRFTDSTNVIRNWAGAATDNAQLVRTIQDVVVIFTVLAWRHLFMNSLWRRFFAWAPIFQVFPQLLASILVSFDVNRNRYIYRLIMSVAEVSGGITSLNPIIPLTEIIQEGSEGVTVGLVLSLQRVIGVFVNTNAQGLFRGDNFYDTKQVAADTNDAHWAVLWSLVLCYGINLLALFGLIFVPSQKLDAQQLRMYGGFTKAASSIIVIVSLSLFLYSTVINVMTFIPTMACHKLIGGKGC